jgi:hypothetical protein
MVDRASRNRDARRIEVMPASTGFSDIFEAGGWPLYGHLQAAEGPMSPQADPWALDNTEAVLSQHAPGEQAQPSGSVLGAWIRSLHQPLARAVPYDRAAALRQRAVRWISRAYGQELAAPEQPTTERRRAPGNAPWGGGLCDTGQHCRSLVTSIRDATFGWITKRWTRSAEMIDFIYDHEGHNIGWMQNGQVFSNADQMIGTVRDGQLYTLDGEPTGLFLGEAGVRTTADTQAKLKSLFEDSYAPS